jgi:hypothetical protein
MTFVEKNNLKVGDKVFVVGSTTKIGIINKITPTGRMNVIVEFINIANTKSITNYKFNNCGEICDKHSCLILKPIK